MDVKVRPLTPKLWPALEDLFEDGATCRRCWCMYWRIGSAYRRQSSEINRQQFAQITRDGPPTGLLAFHGKMAVGWCQLTPRTDLPWLERTSLLKPVDDTPVWCLSCFYIRKGYRRQGLTELLIKSAAERARRAGVPALEAYPLDRDFTPSSSSTGFASTFARLGFKTVVRRSPGRPIMRLAIVKPANA